MQGLWTGREASDGFESKKEMKLTKTQKEIIKWKTDMRVKWHEESNKALKEIERILNAKTK